MNELAIRLARSADARHIANLSRCLIELGLRGWSWNPARVTHAIQHRNMCVIVAEAGSPTTQFAGFAIAEFGETHVHLSLLAVDATHQRQGVGSALMQWLEQSALTAGITDMHLELRTNNTGARGFYEALGYTRVRAVPSYYGGVEAALKMHKPLGLQTSGARQR